MKYLIGIDVGTSGTKAVLFDTEGTVINSCTEEYPLIQPKVGWAEQDPHDWWNAVKKALTAITAGVDKNDIAGLGLTGQMHGLVMLDDAGEVLTNAIIWCDGRTTEELPPFEDYNMENHTYKFFKGEPLYPFGHGLTYSDVTEEWIDGETVKLTNNGEYDVNYTVLRYEYIPHKSLCGFKKVKINANETVTVKFGGKYE